jgi:hypothetical protein
MKYLYHRLAALGMAAASLSSCSRSAYTFNPATPAYLGSTRTVAVPKAAATLPVAAAAPSAPVSPQAPIAVAPAPIAAARPVATAQIAPAAEVASPTLTIARAKPAKLTLMQRLALKKVAKQLAKAETHPQNTASVAKTAAKGPGITVGIVGLAALVVGLIVSSGFLIVAGSIVLAVGIVLYVLSIL